MARSIAVFWALVSSSLTIGTIGYHHLAGLGWVDALLNAAMILTGMGPVSPLHDTTAKLFAAAYALFSGVIFLVSVGIVITPLLHRFLHRFHLEEDESERRSA
jgi:hypothetical protein